MTFDGPKCRILTENFPTISRGNTPGPPWGKKAGIKLGRIPPDLRPGISCLRSTTSNNRSCTSQLRSGTFLPGSTTLHSLYLSIFLYACSLVKNVVLCGHFVICICPCLVWILDRRCRRRETHLCSRPSDSNFGPSSLTPQ